MFQSSPGLTSASSSTLGRTAAVSGDVHRYGFPRTDLQVTRGPARMPSSKARLRPKAGVSA